MTNASSLHEEGTQSQCFETTQGPGAEGGGRGVQNGKTHVHPWLIHADVWKKPPQ